MRHIPPPVANTFELDRFEGVNIKDIHRDGDIYIYEATAQNLRKTDSHLYARYNVCPQDERVSCNYFIIIFPRFFFNEISSGNFF